MGGTYDEPLIVDGVRTDGRKAEDIRPIKMEVGVLKRADGSARVEVGDTKAIAAVYGPREMHPRHDTLPNKAVVRCKYTMISFSVDDRARPGPSRRSTEISKVLSEALESVVFTDKYPGMVIDVFVDIYQASASTRVTGLTAAALALADAGIPMRDLVTAFSVGKIAGTQKGKPVQVVVADVNKLEDNYGMADLALAIQPKTKKVVLLQMDGNFTVPEYKKALDLALKVGEQVYAKQVDALKKKYEIEEVEVDAE